LKQNAWCWLLGLRISIPQFTTALWLVWSNVDLETMTITASLAIVTHSGWQEVVLNVWPFSKHSTGTNKNHKIQNGWLRLNRF